MFHRVFGIQPQRSLSKLYGFLRIAEHFRCREERPCQVVTGLRRLRVRFRISAVPLDGLLRSLFACRRWLDQLAKNDLDRYRLRVSWIARVLQTLRTWS